MSDEENPQIEPPPDLIRGSYTTDLNIFKIHEAVEERFDFFEAIVPNLKKEIKEQEKRLLSDERTLFLNDKHLVQA